MRKGFFGICLSLVVAIVLLAAFLPSCGPATPTTGTIVVKATRCGIPWPAQGTGAVNYTLTPTGGAPVSGTAVPTTHSNMTATTWTCAYLGGAPPGAFLNSTQPSATQSLSAGGTITFTFDFELNQDAAIEFLTWTQNGNPMLGPTLEAWPCQIIDVHFKQWVDGCQGYNVTVNETSKLWIHYIGYSETPGGEPMPGPNNVFVYVVNDDCAVNKTVPQAPPPVKRSQVTSFKGMPVMPSPQPYPINFCDNTTYLDVETQWQLVKCLNYTKSINWFGISMMPPFQPGAGMEHDCVLFELVFNPPTPGWYHFTLVAEAELKLVGDQDVNPGNNKAMSPPITLIVWLPGP